MELTWGENVSDIVLTSQNELVDNVKIHDSCEHNQIHLDIRK